MQAYDLRISKIQLKKINRNVIHLWQMISSDMIKFNQEYVRPGYYGSNGYK